MSSFFPGSLSQSIFIKLRILGIPMLLSHFYWTGEKDFSVKKLTFDYIERSPRKMDAFCLPYQCKTSAKNSGFDVCYVDSIVFIV